MLKSAMLRLLVIDAVVLLLLIPGFQQLREKAAIVKFASVDTPVVLAPAPGGAALLHPGDIVLAVDGREIHSTDELELLCDRFRIGDTVLVDARHPDGGQAHLRVPLGRFYSDTDQAVAALTGAVFFLLGLIVLVKRPDDEAARALHVVMILGSIVVIATPGCYTIPPMGVGHVLRVVDSFAAALLPAAVLSFTLVFPSRRWARTDAIRRAAVGIGLAIGGVRGGAFAFGVGQGTPGLAAVSLHMRDASNVFLVVCFVASGLAFAHSFRVATRETRRRKLRWVLAGIVVGPCSVAVLYYGPMLVFGAPLIGETTMVLCACASALLFAVGIVQQQVLDIEFVVTRGVAYTVVLAVLGAVYVGVVAVLAAAIGTTSAPSSIPAIVAAVLVAVLFTPVRVRVKHAVDKQFFRVRYDYRTAQRGYMEQIATCVDVADLARLMVDRTDALIPVERVGFFTLSPSGTRLQLLAHRGFELLMRHGVAFAPEQLRSTLARPLALGKQMEAGLDVEIADADTFDRWGIAIAFPMRSEGDTLLGFLALGPKKSEARFIAEDIDLLRAASIQAGATLDRVRLQTLLAVEHAESKRLEELNALKSYFVSGVSHELKTPLTSIRMYAELLGANDELPRETAREYVGIIEGESARLSRLIDNVLDFAKIERGTKNYRFAPVRINDVVSYVMRTMTYQFTMHRCAVETRFDEAAGMIRADADAVAEAVINLLSNALKYSGENKWIGVETSATAAGVAVVVRDRGIGISAEDRQHIFEPFFRSSDPAAARAGGAGLGLSLVHHIMIAHGGTIELDSTPGQGSVVTLHFPANADAKNSDH